MAPLLLLVIGCVRVEAAPKGPLTDGEFKRASWDWVQNATAATAAWGDIGDWDVSGVSDFSWAFSTTRNVAGNKQSAGDAGNPNAVAFVGGNALSKWITSSATSLSATFLGAESMNADLSGWSVTRVISLQQTFAGASKFVGTGLGSWITAAVTTLYRTFDNAGEMNSDLSKWQVGKVVRMYGTFAGASKFNGKGLDSWDTSSVTTLYETFYLAGEMNADLSKWQVGKVVTLRSTFEGASKFAGAGLNFWNTSSVTDLEGTFRLARKMNVDLSGWTVSKVKDSGLRNTFLGASNFVGTGLGSWDITSVTTLKGTFNGASRFTGTDLGSWDTSSVNDLQNTFYKAGEMNSDLSGWKVGNVTTLFGTFNGAFKFSGTGLGLWITTSVTTLYRTFQEAVDSDRTRSITCTHGAKTVYTKTTDTVCNDVPCEAGITWSITGNAPCVSCAANSTCGVVGVAKACTKTTNTMCREPAPVIAPPLPPLPPSSPTADNVCGDGMYMHRKKCTTTCPDGYYGDRGGTSAAEDGTLTQRDIITIQCSEIFTM